MEFVGVTFSYRRGGHPVVKDLSWRVPDGRVVLLGPNGAGKSTLLALAAGALPPREGYCLVANQRHPPRTHRSARAGRYRSVVGWMPQTVRPVRGLRVKEQVAFAGWLHGLSRGHAQREALNVLELVDLASLADRRANELSGGQLRRLGLAEALVHRPHQLLLDEPTAGLDPAQRIRFREVLSRLPADVNVLVSTHQVDDLEETYHGVAVMIEGVMLFRGPVDDFMKAAPQGATRAAEAAYAAVASTMAASHDPSGGSMDGKSARAPERSG